MKLRNLTFHSFLTAGLMIGLMPVVSAADPVDERIEGFKESKRGVARIEDAILKGDALTVADQARVLAMFAEKIPSNASSRRTWAATTSCGSRPSVARPCSMAR